MSEVHLGCPPYFSGPHISRFTFSLPPDHGDEVLGNYADNVPLNLGIIHSAALAHVRELDWMDSWPTKVVENSQAQERYAWTSVEVEELQKASLIIAADVIYSNDLTDAFFKTLERLMKLRPDKVWLRK